MGNVALQVCGKICLCVISDELGASNSGVGAGKVGRWFDLVFVFPGKHDGRITE